MNIIQATIVDLEQFEGLTLIKANAQNQFFSAIIVDDLSAQDDLGIGSLVNLGFKETEVSIGLAPIAISLRNQIHGKISHIQEGKLLSRVVLDTSFGQVKSLITTGSVKRLQLIVGKEVIALVKTNEMLIEVA